MKTLDFCKGVIKHGTDKVRTAQILLIFVLVATIMLVCLLFGIPASKYNKEAAKEEMEERK